jgi:hypothetical protein
MGRHIPKRHMREARYDYSSLPAGSIAVGEPAQAAYEPDDGVISQRKIVP